MQCFNIIYGGMQRTYIDLLTYDMYLVWHKLQVNI